MATTESKLEGSVKTTLADVKIHWGHDYDGPSLVPVLRLGGSLALSRRLRGLVDLLEAHEVLNEDALDFTRTTLGALASALYPDDDDDLVAASMCVIVPRAEPAQPKTRVTTLRRVARRKGS